MDLFPSTLFTSSDNQLINQHVNQICDYLNNIISPNNPDIFIINETTGWTIELTRQIKTFLSKKPFNHQNKIVIIYDAHNLNNESQNALLKTLEDPGPNNFIIITTSKPSKLLLTITSRCKFIKLKNTNTINFQDQPLTISHNLKKDLILSEIISKDKTQVLPFLENQLKIYQQILVKDPSIQNSQTIQRIIKSINMIESNVDPRSALDFIFLS
jgi:DNA polymerase III delta prime subunit